MKSPSSELSEFVCLTFPPSIPPFGLPNLSTFCDFLRFCAPLCENLWICARSDPNQSICARLSENLSIGENRPLSARSDPNLWICARIVVLIAKQGGVTIEHYYRSDDHAYAHLHVRWGFFIFTL